VERRDTAPAVGLDRRSTPPASPTPAVVPPRPVRGHFYGPDVSRPCAAGPPDDPGIDRESVTSAMPPPGCSVCSGSTRQRFTSITREHELFRALSENDNVKYWEGWRRSDCQYIYANGDLDSKGQCKACRNLDKNLRPDRFPDLFPEQVGDGVPSDEAEEVEDRRTISEAVIEDEEKFCGCIVSRLGSHWGGRGGEDGGCLDVSCDEELSVAAKQMKLADELVLDLRDGRVFTCCQGDGCDKCFVRKSRANASTLCKECKDKRGNDVRYARHREGNRDIRVDPKSSVPLKSLGE
ncbi:hypothetical protein THAOC_05062, partial [Thalassiosira oceanica]